MSVRTWLNEHRGFSVGVVLALLVLCGWYLFSQVNTLFATGIPGGAYYTVDDGKTWFGGEFNRTTPFDSGGKEAVEAHVFECDGKKFVAYLTRHNKQAKEAIDKFNAARAAGKPVDADLAKGMAFAGMAGKEFKAPGGDKWIPQGNAAEISKLTAPKCDDGTPAEKVIP